MEYDPFISKGKALVSIRFIKEIQKIKCVKVSLFTEMLYIQNQQIMYQLWQRLLPGEYIHDKTSQIDIATPSPSVRYSTLDQMDTLLIR